MSDPLFNITDIINRVKARLGASFRELEITDTAIYDILMNETLKTLSVYFPKTSVVVVDPESDRVEFAEPNVFFLRTDETVINIVSVIGADPGNYQNGIYDELRFTQFNVDPSQRMMFQMQNEIYDAYQVPYSAILYPPNMVQITPRPRGGLHLVLRVNVAHTDFNQFHPGLREHIMRLAEYDVKLDILGIRQYFQQISTGFEQIELNLGTFQEAEQKRDELTQLFREKRQLSQNRKRLWYM